MSEIDFESIEKQRKRIDYILEDNEDLDMWVNFTEDIDNCREEK